MERWRSLIFFGAAENGWECFRKKLTWTTLINQKEKERNIIIFRKFWWAIELVDWRICYLRNGRWRWESDETHGLYIQEALKEALKEAYLARKWTIQKSNLSLCETLQQISFLYPLKMDQEAVGTASIIGPWEEGEKYERVKTKIWNNCW